MSTPGNSPEELWRTLLRIGELSFGGYLVPENCVLDDQNDNYTLIETYLLPKPVAKDGRAIRVRVTIKLMSRDGSH